MITSLLLLIKENTQHVLEVDGFCECFQFYVIAGIKVLDNKIAGQFAAFGDSFCLRQKRKSRNFVFVNVPPTT